LEELGAFDLVETYRRDRLLVVIRDLLSNIMSQLSKSHRHRVVVIFLGEQGLVFASSGARWVGKFQIVEFKLIIFAGLLHFQM
jgi:hypothetical protein